ncbi:hypothetical protein GDO81_026894 [Engystomops pustulosus]|uniref:Uncharacterized protein n=1 Tax=Engystomops pustulosus TaxID=76066 RepID=A0AAV6ZET1_ENGPU|nr:hypothetical protein GDO81_026894 [Engystomops pustulosus]
MPGVAPARCHPLETDARCSPSTVFLVTGAGEGHHLTPPSCRCCKLSVFADVYSYNLLWSLCLPYSIARRPGGH